MKLSSHNVATFASTAILFASVNLASVQASAQTPFKDTGTSSFLATPQSGGAIMLQRTETNYLISEYPALTVLKTTTTSTSLTNGEGEDAKSVLEMRANGSGLLDKVLWTATAEGGDVKYFNDEIVNVTQYGCCGSENIIRVFNAKTGSKIEAAMREIYEIEVLNSKLSKRYMSLVVDSKAPETFAGKSYIATISYYSKDKIIGRARIYGAVPPTWGASINNFILTAGSKTSEDDNRLHISYATRQTDPAKAFDGILLTTDILYDSKSEKVRLVISNDAIDERASTVSSDLAIQFVK